MGVNPWLNYKLFMMSIAPIEARINEFWGGADVSHPDFFDIEDEEFEDDSDIFDQLEKIKKKNKEAYYSILYIFKKMPYIAIVATKLLSSDQNYRKLSRKVERVLKMLLRFKVSENVEGWTRRQALKVFGDVASETAQRVIEYSRPDLMSESGPRFYMWAHTYNGEGICANCAIYFGKVFRYEDLEVVPPLHLHCNCKLIVYPGDYKFPSVSTDFEDTFKKFSPSTQITILGKKRFKLYTEGKLSFNEFFTKNLRLIPLKKLKKKHKNLF